MSLAPWMLAGFTGAGALLSGTLLYRLRRLRREHERHRRPGRALASPDPVLNPVEKTVTTIGEVTAPTIEHLDAILRRLAAAHAAADIAMPDLATVELAPGEVTLHLDTPSALPAPWTSSVDQLRWSIPAATPPDQVGPHIEDQPAPYPLLATIGLDDTDHAWLINLEDTTLTITGDTDFAQDYARHLALEVACAPWSSLVQVDCFGIATELAPISPDLLHIHNPAPEAGTKGVIADALAQATTRSNAATHFGTDQPTARAHQLGADAWPAHLLLLNATSSTERDVHDLAELIEKQAGRTGTALVACNGQLIASTETLEFTSDGRVLLPGHGLDLIAAGLTQDEAEGFATLVAHHQNPADAPTPRDENPPEGWPQWADHAGALRQEHTIPRHSTTPGLPDSDAEEESTSADGDEESARPAAVTQARDDADASSLLDQPDEAYTSVAATTEEDLSAIAPRVPTGVRRRVQETDPTLDGDVALWFSDNCPLPRLRLLGPVRATTRGEPLASRKPYMTELLTYLALKPRGATNAEVSETFNITPAKTRDYILKIRRWLGTNPRTGEPHLPNAKDAPSAALRGTPVYEVVDLLLDIDIFRRLRLRAQARGTDGIADLITALRLVDGRPFDYAVEREAASGWAWLIDGDRIDQHIKAAIVDVAHIITTHALANGDLPTARMAAETAALAVSSEEIPHLDLAAVATAEGNHAEASHIFRDQISNRTDDENPPPEVPTRTNQILRQRHRRRAS